MLSIIYCRMDNITVQLVVHNTNNLPNIMVRYGENITNMPINAVWK